MLESKRSESRKEETLSSFGPRRDRDCSAESTTDPEVFFFVGISGASIASAGDFPEDTIRLRSAADLVANLGKCPAETEMPPRQARTTRVRRASVGFRAYRRSLYIIKSQESKKNQATVDRGNE